jgi:ribosomal protein S18 acetylase RimI-like enzyme
LEWSIEEKPEESDLATVYEGVYAAGRAISKSEASPLACFVRLKGSLIAGVTGRTEFSRLYINYLWVAEEYRGQGIGARLLSEIEAAAVARGCSDAVIETLLESVVALYLRRGYLSWSVVPNFVGPFSRHTLKKQLSGSA